MESLNDCCEEQFHGWDPQPFLKCPSRQQNYNEDVTGEGGRQPDSIDIEKLDEAAIKRGWNNGKGLGDFSLWNNCADIVGEALRTGGLPIRRTSFYTTPDYIKNEVERLLRERTYPPPMPQPPPLPHRIHARRVANERTAPRFAQSDTAFPHRRRCKRLSLWIHHHQTKSRSALVRKNRMVDFPHPKILVSE